MSGGLSRRRLEYVPSAVARDCPAVSPPPAPPPVARLYEHFAAGHWDEAEAGARQRLAHWPEEIPTRLVLALALSARRRPDEALPHFEWLASVQPEEPAHWVNLGHCLCELDRAVEALAPLERAERLGARDEAFLLAMVRALLAHQRVASARPLAEALVRRAPDDPEAVLLYVRTLLANEEPELAAEAMAAFSGRPLDPEAALEAGHLLLEIGLYEDALARFREAAAASPEQVEARLGIASALERLNRVDEAVAVFATVAGVAEGEGRVAELALELDAQLAARRGEHGRAIAGYRRLCARSRDLAARGDLHLKLARSLAEAGRAEEAIAEAGEGHRLKLARVRAAHAGMPPGERLLAVLDEPVPPVGRFHDAGPVGAPPDPVFVVGFPRSGTTLLEQLLDAHEALASFDEQPFLHRLVTELERGGTPYPAALASLDRALAGRLRERYFTEVGRRLGEAGGRRAVDKNPLNLVRLPLVAALFPQAHVILALRHPCDVVLSCFMQNFRSPAFAVTFATLESTAAMYAKVMAHWQRNAAALGLPVHLLRYEELVADVAGEGRRLFDFLGLPWDDSLLAFTERARAKGAISTPSYAQVVQPVNRRAVGRWQAYRTAFESSGALRLLEPWIEAFGYEA